jgi:hypothetical protein
MRIPIAHGAQVMPSGLLNQIAWGPPMRATAHTGCYSRALTRDGPVAARAIAIISAAGHAAISRPMSLMGLTFDGAPRLRGNRSGAAWVCADVALPRAIVGLAVGRQTKRARRTRTGLQQGSLSAEFHMCYQCCQQQHRGHPG